MRTDDQLVALFRLGNDEAFRIIHDRYRQRLYSYTRQMLAGSRSDAEDALQDVFLRAYHALRVDNRPVTLRAWLYRVAHNRCIDHLRRVGGGGIHVVELFENVRSLHDPIEEAQRREDLQRLVADVRRLPEQQRSALLMRELEGLSYRELSDALEVTVPAVKSLLVRARMGLVEAQTARDTACVDIRDDLVDAHDRGVRASGRARRHMRECSGCRDYRSTLKGVASGLSALQPGPSGWTLLAKVFGIGGAGSGAAAGGTAAAGGGAAATGTIAVGGGAAAVTATKVAAVVCCAALVGGGAAEVKHVASDSTPKAAHAASAAASSTRLPAPIPAVVRDRPSAARPALVSAPRRHDAKRHAVAPAVKAPAFDHRRSFGGLSGAIVTDEEQAAADKAGGILAPEEDLDVMAPVEGASQAGTNGTAPTSATSGSGTTGTGSGNPSGTPSSGGGTTSSGDGGPSGSSTGGSAPVAQGATAPPPPAG